MKHDYTYAELSKKSTEELINIVLSLQTGIEVLSMVSADRMPRK